MASPSKTPATNRHSGIVTGFWPFAVGRGVETHETPTPAYLVRRLVARPGRAHFTEQPIDRSRVAVGRVGVNFACRAIAAVAQLLP
jgi:hypothetical protein